MGGRGSFSGLDKTIDDVLGGSSGGGQVDEINPDQFSDLFKTEDMIRSRSKEVLVVFDKSGKAIKAYQGNKTSVAFPCDEAQKWKGCIVTHNHPKGKEGFGGTFSWADMRNATVYQFGSHRAVAAGQGEMNYILKAKRNARPMQLNRRIASDIPDLKEKMHAETAKIKKDYLDNKDKYKNYGHALHVARQKSVGVLNSYYKEIAEQYGYTYRAQK